MSEKKSTISSDLGIENKTADSIIDWVRHIFEHENKNESFILKEISKRYKKQPEQKFAAYVLGCVKVERINKNDAKFDVLKMLADRLLGRNDRKAAFWASLEAMMVLIFFVGAVSSTASMFVAGFTFWKLFSVVWNIGFAIWILKRNF